MALMASFMHDYVGGAAKAMSTEIGDLRTGMAKQSDELRSSMAAQNDDLRSSMAAQGDKMVADLGTRIDEQISAKLDEHRIQELVDGNAKSLAASHEAESASRDLRKTFEEFLETQRRAIQNQPAPFTGFSGPPPRRLPRISRIRRVPRHSGRPRRSARTNRLARRPEARPNRAWTKLLPARTEPLPSPAKTGGSCRQAVADASRPERHK
jgi:hypothetical protein